MIGSSGTSDSRESRFFNPMVPQESLRTRLSSAFQSLLVAVHLATPHANVHYVLDSDSGSKSGLKSGLELGAVAERKAQTRIVHASIINKDEIYICKIANGEDWLLGMGSYGMVRPDACNSRSVSCNHILSLPACLKPFALECLPLPVLACLPACPNLPACVSCHLSLPICPCLLVLPSHCRVPIHRSFP